MNAYHNLAQSYDVLTRDVDYEATVAFYNEILDNLSLKPRTAVDLACGTGSVAILLAKQGLEVTGVDLSEDMLCGLLDVTKKDGFAIPLGLICAAMTQLIYKNLSELRGMVEWTSGAWWVVAVYAVLPLALFACAIRKKGK